VRRQQCLSAEGFDADKHFETPSHSQERDQLFLIRNLRVALNKEWQADTFGMICSKSSFASLYLWKFTTPDLREFRMSRF
jgi:hypothetical protein